MSIFIPTNGGKSFVYIPTTTTQHNQSSQAQPMEVDPAVAFLIIGVVAVLFIAFCIWCERMLKD